MQLVYHKIPRDAVIKTITVEDIQALASRLPSVGATLRLNQIAVFRKSYSNKILPELKAQNVKLTPTVVKSFAAIVKLLGMDHNSPLFVSGIVSDICFGWGIIIERHTKEEWSEKGDLFAAAMCLGRTAQLEDYYVMKAAFRDGVRWGKATSPNPKFRADSARKAIKKAATIGLESPTKSLLHELDAAKLAVMRFGNAQLRALPAEIGGLNSRALLCDGPEADDNNSRLDERLTSPDHTQYSRKARKRSVRASGWNYDDVDDEGDDRAVLRQFREVSVQDSDDAGSVYEL